MLKKYSKAFLAATMSLSLLLSACGAKTNQEASGDSSKKEYIIKIGYENQPGEPLDLAAKEWKKLAEEKSNGQIKIELFPSSQLGSKKDVIEQMQMGANVLHIADASFLMEYVPDIGILSAPYLVDNYEQMWKLTNSDWFKGLEKQLQDKGIHIVSTKWVYGDRHLITSKPVTKPEDLKGLKVRVPNNPLSIKIMEKMGATPTPMPLGEVYPAMAQGVIDGMENPLPVIWGSKVYENGKNLALTAHTNMITQWLAGQSYIKTLPEDIVKILKETGDQAGEFMAQKVKESETKVIEDLKAAGVTVADADKNAFKEASKPLYSEIKEWSPGLYDTVQGLLK